ncbi:chemotaxis protein CheW [Chitinibacter sp. SCUT-21]|uniref:chemotaxis protein CheW n=1 Tax=Chitinibacter sp. SCUT-21 TaxID=2970891 RepID=UPI0035A5C0B4
MDATIQAKLTASVTPSASRAYGVIAGGVHLLLPQGLSAELLHDQTITRVLLAPSALRGVSNVRGALLPVFDFGVLIGGQSQEDGQLLMLGQHPGAVGMLVQSYPQALSNLVLVPDAPVPEILKPHLRNIWQQQQQYWLEIDFLPLFRDLAARQAPSK